MRVDLLRVGLTQSWFDLVGVNFGKVDLVWGNSHLHFSILLPPLRPPWCWSCGQHLCDRHQLTPNLPLGWLWVQAHHTQGLPASWCWPVSTRHQGQCSWTVPVCWQSPVGQRCLLDTSSSLVSISTAADSRDTALCQNDQLHQAIICESMLLPKATSIHIQGSRQSCIILRA